MDRLDLRAELAFALDRGELAIVYQPICELKSRKILAFEALLRWTHPERGRRRSRTCSSPLPRRPARSCQSAHGCSASPAADYPSGSVSSQTPTSPMGVNISAVQLENSSQDLLDVILRTGVDPDDVWLEVTERMDTSGDIADQVAKLRSAGVHFALDDFGMSYSSLIYLKRFPVEGIKIDRTFVAPMTDDETQRAIVQGDSRPRRFTVDQRGRRRHRNGRAGRRAARSGLCVRPGLPVGPSDDGGRERPRAAGSTIGSAGTRPAEARSTLSE